MTSDRPDEKSVEISSSQQRLLELLGTPRASAIFWASATDFHAEYPGVWAMMVASTLVKDQDGRLMGRLWMQSPEGPIEATDTVVCGGICGARATVWRPNSMEDAIWETSSNRSSSAIWVCCWC